MIILKVNNTQPKRDKINHKNSKKNPPKRQSPHRPRIKGTRNTPNSTNSQTEQPYDQYRDRCLQQPNLLHFLDLINMFVFVILIVVYL